MSHRLVPRSSFPRQPSDRPRPSARGALERDQGWSRTRQLYSDPVAKWERSSSEDTGQLAVARELLLNAPATAQAVMETAGEPDANLRAGIFGEQSDGTRFCAEVALNQPPPGHAVICTGRPMLVPNPAAATA